jgi:hypothetical protein
MFDMSEGASCDLDAKLTGQRRKLCDMAKPQCGACDRLRMECVWPEVKSFERGQSQLSDGSSGDMTPASVTGPSTGGSTTQTSGAFETTPTASHLFAPHTEQSAVDGLMNLFTSDGALAPPADPFGQAQPTAPDTAASAPMPAFAFPSNLSLPSHSLPHPHVSAGDLFSGNDIFSFDDVGRTAWGSHT